MVCVKYFDEVASHYQERSQTGFWNQVRNVERRAVLEALDIKPGERVLDVGCGAGFYSRELVKLGAHVSGIDSSGPMLDQFRMLKLVAYQGKFESFQFENRFDKVLVAGAGEFISDLKLLLSQLEKVLEPSGRAVILAPRSNLLGVAYKLWHRSHGCEVSLHNYRKVNTFSSALTTLSIRNLTFLSTLITLQRNI